MFKIQNLEFASKGYYINLDKSVERKDNVEKLKARYEITDLDRFSALTDEWIQFACTKSHLKVFEEASKDEHEIIFVAEDDMDVRDTLYLPYSDKPVSFTDKIKDIHNELKNVEWDVLLLGCNPKTYLIPVSNSLGEVHRSTGGWAYLIKKRAYEYVLKNLNYHRDLLAIDDFLPRLSDNGFKVLCTIPMAIHHAVGFESTLQPRGPVNYDAWIEGNFQKYLYDFYKGDLEQYSFERNTTVVIAGHFCENFLFYLNYLLHSLPDKLKKCKLIVNYDDDNPELNGISRINLIAYFRDKRSDLNVEICFTQGGLISSFDNFLKKIITPYFVFLEHDWVFLKKDSIDFTTLKTAFDNHNFINAVWFSKDDNKLRGFEIAEDVEKKVTPFDKEDRVSVVSLTTTCRWSNNPVMFRTSKMKYWYTTNIKNEYVGKINQRAQNVEESMIPKYRKEISENKWETIRDNWGTFLYGKLGEGPYVAHTDASKRYQGSNKSQPEINGEDYIKNNPIEL